MNVSHFELSPDILSNMNGCTDDAATMLGIDLSRQSPEHVIEAINAFLLHRQDGERPTEEESEDLSYTLGSLWGEQLVRVFGWDWAGVTFHDHDDSNAVGVLSPDRSLAIYPFHFVYGCLMNDAPVTILLAYNMLKDGSRIPEIPPATYENVMDHVHHIAPPGKGP